MESERWAKHGRFSARLGSCSDGELAALLGAGGTGSVGVGGSSVVVDVDGTSVFAKRVPLTDLDLELAHPHSTANLFGLPLHCQYGIGSPGFNAWRELAATSMVTEAQCDVQLVGLSPRPRQTVGPAKPSGLRRAKPPGFFSCPRG
jgi:hypothetical protein